MLKNNANEREDVRRPHRRHIKNNSKFQHTKCSISFSAFQKRKLLLNFESVFIANRIGVEDFFLQIQTECVKEMVS